MKTANTLLAMAIAAAASTTVVAGTSFEALDTDGNGAISKEEASAAPEVLTKFDELDTDSNGELSKEEFAHVE